jgi:hypothetical protein
MWAAPAVKLSGGDRVLLKRWSRERLTPARLLLRSKTARLAASGLHNKDIAREFLYGTKTLCLRRRRFAQYGIAAIEKDASRGGKWTKKV